MTNNKKRPGQLDQATLDELLRLYPDLQDILPLTPLQQGLAFESVALSPNTHDPYHVAALFIFEGALDPKAMERAWTQLIARHAVLRLVLAPTHLAPNRAIICNQQFVDWKVLDLSGTKAQRLAQLKADDLAQPFNLEQGPLIRARLAALGEQEYALL
ncbi:hypothetical protein ICN41_11180, partial [Polynucleobacter sp. 15G-AUS-farblos]|uniref:condensation domain-containing protein n=1 Tax=Polynucleobacter sp. 15G-AUS-farblos TaxID=2689094 RepID=UPI001C0C31EA